MLRKSTLARPDARPSRTSSCSLHRFFSNLVGELNLEVEKGRIRLHPVVSGTGEPDRNVSFDSSRPRAHDHTAAPEEDCLFNVMGDEQHRLAVCFPDIQQKFLHQTTRLVVKRAEGLVKKQD